MKCRITGERPVVGGGHEYHVLLEDNNTGRIFLCRPDRGSAMRIVRAVVADPHRPLSSVAVVPDGSIEVRRNAVYVNRPMRGSLLAVVVKAEDAPVTSSSRASIRAIATAEAMTIVERGGELADEPVDDLGGVDENPSDAPRQPPRRGETE